MIEWWNYLFLGLALLVWPACYLLSGRLLPHDRKPSDTERLATFVASGAIGSWLLSFGLLFMPMIAVLCFIFSMFVSVVGAILGVAAFFQSPGPTRMDR